MNSPTFSTNEDEGEEFCSCKSTCATKRCPCKTANRHCTAICSCGTKRKACTNKPEGAVPNQGRIATAEPDGLSEEQERNLENRRVKDFIMTLDEDMAKKLAIRALQRGVGSMEFVDMLLIMEDPEDPASISALPSSINQLSEQAGSSSEAHTPLFAPPPTSSFDRSPEPLPEWCKCGNCRTMPQEIENKCCNYRNCSSETRRFRKLCLDPEYLQLSIRNTGDIRNDREDNSSRAFRKAAYRHFILDKYGYLGKGKRKICPSCCVVSIRHHYPSPTGVYMGFRSH